jgi:hypothetical protein
MTVTALDALSNNVTVVGSPVSLSGLATAAEGTVTGGPLSFGGVYAGTTSAPRTLTINSTGTNTLTISTLTISANFSRPAGAAGGTCGATTPFNVLAGNNCTINIVFQPTSGGNTAYNGSVTITGNAIVSGSPVGLSGTGLTPPAKPALTVLDNFNRANANTLGASWTQATAGGSAAIRIVDVTPGDTTTGVANANSAGNATWNTAYGTATGRAAAAFTISNATLSGDALILDGTGGFLFGAQASYIRVRYTSGTGVTVAACTFFGFSCPTAATFPASFANGDTITAMVDVTGTVYVWKTSGGTDTFLGLIQLPSGPWTTGGRIGILLPSTARIDNFAGGTVP